MYDNMIISIHVRMRFFARTQEGCMMMKKAWLWLTALLIMLISSGAMAEIYVFDDLFASMEVPDSYIVLTDKNLPNYAAWLEARGSSLEDTQADFYNRGVLLQAWNEEMDTCFELRAHQDDESMMMFDVNEQTSEVRGTYRTSHYPRNEYPGYDFSSSEWKNTDEGRFLCLQYVYRDHSEILHRGFMRRTIRNGYEIDFDMMAVGRNLTNKDNTALNKIWETFRFIEVKPLPPVAAAKIFISSPPPEESNQQQFDIEGTAMEGVKLTAVTMGLSHPEPVVSEVVVGKSGKFSLPIKLPREGVFGIAITGEYQGEEVVELYYPITYQRTLLAVNFTQKPAASVTTDEVTIAGTSEPGASIQVFLDGETLMTKKVTSAGKFSIDVEAKEEGQHEVTLVFTRKDLADRRFVISYARSWTDSDMVKYLSKQAIDPTYAQLQKNIADYEGRIVGYRAYILDVAQSGDDFIITMALSKKDGKYLNPVLVIAPSEPTFAIGERVMMYGTCEGMSLSTGIEGEEEAEESYPCFSLLLFASLE